MKHFYYGDRAVQFSRKYLLWIQKVLGKIGLGNMLFWKPRGPLPVNSARQAYGLTHYKAASSTQAGL